jgi:hypothetical protein
MRLSFPSRVGWDGIFPFSEARARWACAGLKQRMNCFRVNYRMINSRRDHGMEKS